MCRCVVLLLGPLRLGFVLRLDRPRIEVLCVVRGQGLLLGKGCRAGGGGRRMVGRAFLKGDWEVMGLDLGENVDGRCLARAGFLSVGLGIWL